MNITCHFPTLLQSEHSLDFVAQQTSSSSGGSSAAKLSENIRFSARATGLPPISPAGGGVMEEKGIVLPELSCRTAAELPLPDYCRFGGAPSTARQLRRVYSGS